MKIFPVDPFSAALAALLAFWLSASAPAAVVVDYPFQTLAAAFQVAAFDPQAPGAACFAITADIHYPGGAPRVRQAIEELNAMQPAPLFLIIAGDLICDGSSSFGSKATEKTKAKARDEFALLRTDLLQLHTNILVKLVPGNHDTYFGEPDMQLFREAFPACPPYDSFEVAGIRFLLLNGGHSGALDEAQMAWARHTMSTVPKAQTVIAVVHQPSLGSVVNERGVPRAVKELFPDSTGELWLLAGHEHVNDLKVYALPKTAIAQATVTSGSDACFGTESPGYWVYCLKEGKVVARIFRSLSKKAWRLDAAPDRAQALPIKLPFEDRQDVAWTGLLGEPSGAGVLLNGRGGDCGEYWFYVSELKARLPLGKLAERATGFAILARLATPPGVAPVTVQVSGDDARWIDLPLPMPAHSVYAFKIPQELSKAECLYVHLLAPGYKANTTVGGFALLK